MTAPWLFRSLIVALFAGCVSLVALSGCGGSAPPPSTEKKEEPKPNPNPTPNPNPNPNPNPGPPVPPKNTLGPVEPEADAAATKFRNELVQGTAKADSLSAAFLKVVGKPLVLPSEKTMGYSPDAATDWLKTVGMGVTIGPEGTRRQAGDVVYIRGGMSSTRFGKEANKTGEYSLRLVKEGGAWKVDWLSLTSVDLTFVAAPPTPEAAAQEFAVVAFIQTIADHKAMTTETRAPLIAAAMTPALRTAWAPPFDQDKNQGYDYSPAQIIPAATKIGGGTKSFTLSRVGDLPEFKVELTKPAGKQTYVVKLVKGTGPNEWLVSEITEAKG